jgi:hypothetical protein
LRCGVTAAFQLVRRRHQSLVFLEATPQGFWPAVAKKVCMRAEFRFEEKHRTSAIS